MSVVEHTSHDHGPRRGRRRTGAGILMRPGLRPRRLVLRAVLPVGLYLVAGIRWLAGWDPVYDWNIIVLVGGLTMGPIGFLLGIGAFDYWLYWISGRPTVPDDHANHGAYRWKDYFKVNTDHKVIGVQYLVTTFVFFVARRPDGDALPRRARAAGHAVHGHADLQRPRLHARRADDLRLHHPGVRRASRTSPCR